jgi:flagellar biosynthesis GTPase FlhF
MSATQQSDRTEDNPSGAAAQRFRAPTVEEALQRARELLGDDAQIIEANRIRRGGIGGFFATELGVEVLAQSPMASGFGTVGTLEPRRGDDYDIRPHTSPASTADVATCTGRAPATDLAASPVRGRAAWRAATDTGSRPLGEEQLTAPLLAALIEQASTQEQQDRSAPAGERPARVFRPWKVADVAGSDQSLADLVADAPTAVSASGPAVGDAGDADAPPSEAAAGTGTFAEHFLRELMSDAEQLRTKPGRNRALPAARPDSLPGIADTADATDATDATDAAAPAPAPRRRQPSRTRSASASRRRNEPQLPLTPASTTGTAAPSPVAAASAVDGANASATATLAAIVDQCVQLAVGADPTTAPTKVALSMTMAGGAVMKLTVELPRSR